MPAKKDAAYWREYRARRRARGPKLTPAPAVRIKKAQPIVIVPTRRRRMKSDVEIRSYIANAMRQYGNSPPALLHVLTGYIVQLTDLMGRDRDDQIADRVCEHKHDGLATGLYCRSCHDAEMSGKFGTIMGQPRGAELAPETDEELLLGGVVIKPGDPEKK